MNLSFNLKLSQSLKLTPLLQQSIKLLQASQVEINDLINEYINENPFLEYEDNLSISKPKNQYTKNYITNENQDDFYDIFENQTKNLTLKEFLIENSGVFSMSEREQLVFYYLIDAINDDGYLITDFHELIN
jgi:RNA polymerase sigma-54 factor